MDDDSKTLKRVLTWVGVAALIALPLVILLRKKRTGPEAEPADDDSMDIYSAELKD